MTDLDAVRWLALERAALVGLVWLAVELALLLRRRYLRRKGA